MHRLNRAPRQVTIDVGEVLTPARGLPADTVVGQYHHVSVSWASDPSIYVTDTAYVWVITATQNTGPIDTQFTMVTVFGELS